MTYYIEEPIVIYLASVVDIETIYWFLLHEDTLSLLMKYQYAITDFLLSSSSA